MRAVANRLGPLSGLSQDILDSADVEKCWQSWIDSEQCARVQAALNIHDAKLAALFHYQPIRSHRFRQFPRLASEKLLSAYGILMGCGFPSVPEISE
ncbi:hypothetical protein N7460_007894 [Penicillium canescens]|uniref:Uncharacterized protein n=1 Tax=Penicillium canescens TaxID=5083 RepID=A0AAD6I957_PENCN|nr:hypothetical protein N7460_007894 [Penicillium canescens]